MWRPSGVGEQALGCWVRLAKGVASGGDTGAVLDADERAELERLRRENADLRLDREFLNRELMGSAGRAHPMR